MNHNKADIENIEADWLLSKNIALDVLRLDKLHPVVSGNKWFKLKYYLQDAIASGKNTVATFGGAYSNHIVAVAFACKLVGLESVGCIRGEAIPVLSNTLQNAIDYGMKLHFVSREEYRKKENIIQKHQKEDWYWIDEGGYGEIGAKGASEILRQVDVADYTHIIAAVGTGTMLAGIVNSANKDQTIIGISSMKGNFSLEQSITNLTNLQKTLPSFQIMHDYHFGGFGKHPKVLIDFINEIYLTHALPLDIVYTAKTFYAIKDLVTNDFFKPGSKLLMIHSGGLQGNKSLPPKVLAF